MAADTDNAVKILLIVIAVIVLLPVLMMLFFAPMMAGHMGWDGNGSIWWAAPWLMLFLAIGYLIYRTSTHLGEEDVLQELQQAYARGDLTDEEYEERRERLETDER